MVPQTFYALVLAVRALLPGDSDPRGGDALQPEPQAAAARYEPTSREVTNWRSEAMDALEPKPVVAMVALFRAERPFVTRCVKLNNYWCIKSARWNGELATDTEGHVGFVSADHSADAAATLLRRYYMEFNRKSALDIVRRWAPAECNVATGIGGVAMLAVRGIGGTVRAQYLASRRNKGGAVRYTAKAGPSGKPGRVSMVIPMASKTPQYRVPSIAAGMGEKPKPARQPEPLVAARRKPAKEPAATASTSRPAPKVQVAAACPSEEQRHRNYAGRMVEGLGLGPTDDLKLFADDGTPLSNLTHVMLAMSAFELGALRASPELVEGAIERAIAKVQENAKAAAQKAEVSKHGLTSVER
ncbi:hypothetical protein VB618_13495 [Microvirga sp. CF3062]|uniref:hypothetical protein n=1 Tax=Microvirga sp. CF3062 TaxID=3110182 RepID=UPI002E785760|nr:hypothetical protein [Microvirga sp. CF3062]MEE1657218.1 hypothetical protein [Microvirga sp. CF3062]